jgi:hypothetical protein
LKFATTVFVPVTYTVQVRAAAFVCVQPLHDATVQPFVGVAVNVTCWAGLVFGTDTTHAAPPADVQSTPAIVTTPRPLTWFSFTSTVTFQDAATKFAVMVRAEPIATVQISRLAPLVELQPDQVPNFEDGSAGAAVTTTLVETGAVFGTCAVQPVVAPFVQSMALVALPGVPVTRPGLPLAFTVRSHVSGSNRAPMVFAPLTVSEQVSPTAVVQPLQLFRIEAAPAVPVIVTFAAGVVLGTVAVQIAPAAQVTSPSTMEPVPPAAAGFSVTVHVAGWNVALTVFAEDIETVQVRAATLEVVQPVHVPRIEVPSGVAVRDTGVGAGFVFGTDFTPVVPEEQRTPSGPETLPAPPFIDAHFTVRVNASGWNVAVTVRGAFIWTEQTPFVTEVQPDQPVCT